MTTATMTALTIPDGRLGYFSTRPAPLLAAVGVTDATRRHRLPACGGRG